MSKISISASRALFGFGILMSLGSVGNAATTLNENITINQDSDFKNYFDPMNAQNIINYKQNCVGECEGSVTININNGASFETMTKHDDRERIHIKLDNADLNINGSGGAVYVTNYDLLAKDANLNDIRLQSMYGASYADVKNLNLIGSTKPTGTDAGAKASILLVNGYDDFNGGLNIDDSDKGNGGNFTADKVLFEAYTPNNTANFRVFGKANIQNSLFVIERNDASQLSLGNGFTYINAGSLNADVTTSNTAKPYVLKNLSSLLPNTDTSGASHHAQYAYNPIDASEFAQYSLSVKKEGGRELLMVMSKLTDKVTDLKAILALDKAILESDYDTDYQDYFDTIQTDINARIQEIDDKIAALGTSTGSAKDHIEMLAPELKNDQLAHGILDSLLTSNLSNDDKSKITMALKDNLKPFTDSIEAAGKSQADSMGANSSANTAMNISNETSITARNVQYSNPYRFAKLLRESKLAALDSDARFDYYRADNFANSLWANAIGGANIIDGDNGSLYGISIGFDREVTDELLVGIYGTYTNSEIKDAGSKSESDNFQLGIYTSYKFAPNWELNTKVYGQLAKTDLENALTTGNVNADYTQRFFGASANVGRIFNPQEGFYVKPFAGVNYYYGYTPDYTERGVLAKHIRSMSSNSMSLEAGAELRKYVNENSYLFITPKIEQYVINNGDDYVASFVGAASNFTIKGSDKKKTYGQVIIGGSVDIKDSLSLNAGVGAKQLLAGKVDSKDETYLSGNIGIKYRF